MLLQMNGSIDYNIGWQDVYKAYSNYSAEKSLQHMDSGEVKAQLECLEQYAIISRVSGRGRSDCSFYNMKLSVADVLRSTKISPVHMESLRRLTQST